MPHADPLWLSRAFAALTLQTVLSALRWRLTAARLGISAAMPGRRVREYYLSQVVNQTLPGGMIGDAGRAVRARAQAGLLAAGQAVVFERLAGQIAMFLCLAVAFADHLHRPRAGSTGRGWLACPGRPVSSPPVSRCSRSCWSGRPSGCRDCSAGGCPGPGTRSGSHAGSRRAVLPPTDPPQHRHDGCNLAAFAFCARAVGRRCRSARFWRWCRSILFTMLIPLSISGWGLREGAAAALFPVAGAHCGAGLRDQRRLRARLPRSRCCRVSCRFWLGHRVRETART